MILTAYGVLYTPYPRYQITMALRTDKGTISWHSKEGFLNSGGTVSVIGYHLTRRKIEKPSEPE